MFDSILRDDLLTLRTGCYCSDDAIFRHNQMKKIIRCRTEDKINLLRYLLTNGIINKQIYNECLLRTEHDYRKANLYLINMCEI